MWRNVLGVLLVMIGMTAVWAALYSAAGRFDDENGIRDFALFAIGGWTIIGILAAGAYLLNSKPRA